MQRGATKADPPPGQLTEAEMDLRFTYHAPANPAQVKKYQEIRLAAGMFAGLLIDVVPESRELSMALDHLDHLVWSANAGIARRSK